MTNGFIEIRESSVEARGMTIAYLEAGEGPLVILTHGFPDAADSWRPTLAGLAEAGFHAVAPFTRGIAPSTAPKRADFLAVTLGEDVLALADALGEDKVRLVGQDWGALFSYIAANIAPERVEKLVTIAIPHPRSVKPQLRLMRGFWHFLFFQLPWLPEWFMKRGDLKGIDFFFRFWSPSTDWTAEQLASIKATYRKPGTLKSALAYYRWMLANPLSERTKLLKKMAGRKIAVPTLTFAGMTDGALAAKEFEPAARCYTAAYELVKVEGAGHFLHLERPDLFLPKLISFLKEDPAGSGLSGG